MHNRIEGQTKWLVKKDNGTTWVTKTNGHVNEIIGRGFFPSTPDSGSDATEEDPYIVELLRHETIPRTNITTHDMVKYYEQTIGVALVIMVDSINLQPFALQAINRLQSKPRKS